jgi:hypothetical protein
MTKKETLEKTKRREKRIITREHHNEVSADRKRQRDEAADLQEKNLAAIAAALKKGNQEGPVNKRPGPEKFFSAFSFIGVTPYDKRHSIPSGYRCHSHNGQKQYCDFFREFIYPYRVPAVLFLAALEKETVVNGNGKTEPSADITNIRYAKKWINDIVSGNSFYKQNKDYFTKLEAHYFLNSEIEYRGPASVLDLCFYAKCMARKMGIKRSHAVAQTFALKFGRHWNHSTVTGFLDLISRSPDCNIEKNGFGDICDFVLNKIERHKKARGRKPPFSFGKRTMASVITLANEWHADLLREQEAQNLLDRVGRAANRRDDQVKHTVAKCWKGFSVHYSRIEDDISAWLFAQLCDVQGLLNEGRLMKNCVSSYSGKCASGESAIFHVSRVFKTDQVCENIATLELSRGLILVQAKGKCNARISLTVRNAIGKWAQLNRIKVNLCY